MAEFLCIFIGIGAFAAYGLYFIYITKYWQPPKQQDEKRKR